MFRTNLTCKSIYISYVMQNHDLDSWPSFFWFSPSHEEERLNPIHSFLEGLFDCNEQLSVPNYAKSEQLESFYFFDDIFLNESRTVSVFDDEVGDKPEDEIQACKSVITCKVRKPIYVVSLIIENFSSFCRFWCCHSFQRASEKSEELEDIESSPLLKRPRLETPSQFPSFKVSNKNLIEYYCDYH